MFKHRQKIRHSLALLLFWGVMFTANPVHSDEPAPSAPPSLAESGETAHDDAQKTIAKIKTLQAALAQQADEIGQRLAQAKAQQRREAVEQLKAILDTIAQIESSYEQQVNTLQRQQSLTIKKRHMQEQIAKLESTPATTQKISFSDLDQAREELNAEISRKATLATKIELAETALQQVDEELQQQQDRIASLKSDDAASEIALQGAQWQLQLVEQNRALRLFELTNEQLAQTAHDTHLTYLQSQVEFLQTHAAFDADELRQQRRRLDKDAFELNRALSRAKEQQAGVKRHLDQLRKKFLNATVDEQKPIEASIDTLQLKFDALQNQIDSDSRRIELLNAGKLVWQRRYAVFNQDVEQAKLPAWREQAKQHLTQLDQEQATLNLWLADWQNRQITLTNKLEDAQMETRLIGQQRDYVMQIIASLQALQTALENSRRLHNKLIDEIDIFSAQQSWRDWVDLTLHYQIYQNTLLDWCYALASALTTFLLLYFLRWILIRKLKHLKQTNEDALINGFLDSIKRANSFFFLMLAVSVASLFLTLNQDTQNIISRLTKVAVVFQAAVWLSGFVRAWVFRILARRTKRDGASMGALSIFNFSSQVVLWSITLLLILQNLGIDVTALVAGLGIGGVAVALSLQRILGDLFSSLSIVLDKPFVVGDFVIFDDFLGSVEHIGIKTTRIRSLTGEQIICANGDLLNTRIRNFKRMHERRVSFKIGVVYQTPPEKLQHIPKLIREIIEAQQPTRFDRAHFGAYGDFALLFEIVYYVLDPDYNLYMDIQQAINLEILKRFEANGIKFAYPTQSLYLKNVEA